MNQICIRIPPVAPEETIELDVTVAGARRLMQYRVESVDCADISAAERAARLRAFIDGYDPRWALVQIGTPTDTRIPVMFRQRPPAGAS